MDPSNLNGVGIYEDDDYEECDCPPVDSSEYAVLTVECDTENPMAGDEVTLTAVFRLVDKDGKLISDSVADLPDGIDIRFTSDSGKLNKNVKTKDSKASATYKVDKKDTIISTESSGVSVAVPVSELVSKNLSDGSIEININDKWYYFDENGYMVTEQYIDGYWIGADGSC